MTVDQTIFQAVPSGRHFRRVSTTAHQSICSRLCERPTEKSAVVITGKYTAMLDVYPYSVRRYDGHSVDVADAALTVLSLHSSEPQALTALSSIADDNAARGGTNGGGGFVLYTTAPDGARPTYRVWARPTRDER